MRETRISETKKLFICSKHFEPEYFECDLKSELLGLLPKSWLKVDEIPTIFTFQVEKRCLVSEKRAKAKIIMSKKLCIKFLDHLVL